MTFSCLSGKKQSPQIIKKDNSIKQIASAGEIDRGMERE
jgi:hypothetical protein